MIRKPKNKSLSVDQPLLHENHKRPVTRREFLGAGLIAGSATVLVPSFLSLMATSEVQAASPSICGTTVRGAGKIPFICFDLGGGANMTGSHVLVGGTGGQLDPLSTAGYNKLGLPDAMIPGQVDPLGGNFINSEFGLAMHSDSAFLRGMLSRTSLAARALCNGAVIPNRSDNDTGNNPHNPMYLIAKAGAGGVGARGDLMSLIGTRASDSGGRSLSGDFLIDTEIRPTKIDRPSDATGLVDTGGIVDQLGLSQKEVKAIMETMGHISGDKINNQSVINDQKLKDLLHCGYIKASYLVSTYGPDTFDPLASDITGGTPRAAAITNLTPRDQITPLDASNPIITASEINGNGTLRKTASVMKMVIPGSAGAGTIELGGYDYHNGTRATGEKRDFAAGEAMGACIEYAHRTGKPLMLYVFTDGSLASNGNIDNSPDGRGKGEWSGDNSSTSASYFIVYDPVAKPILKQDAIAAERHQQLGYMRSSGSVETNGTTPGANNVNLLAQMVALNYMALHGEQAAMASTFWNGHGLGDASNFDSLIAFEKIGSIGSGGIMT